MTILDTFFIYALLISNALLAAAAALAIMKIQRLAKSSARFWDSPTGGVLRAQSDQGSNYKLIDERLASLQDAVDMFEHINSGIQSPTEKLPFENAVRIAKSGASLDELVRTCGLSKGEAHLFMKVHARSAA